MGEDFLARGAFDTLNRLELCNVAQRNHAWRTRRVCADESSAKKILDSRA